jgi:hypothetical protein
MPCRSAQCSQPKDIAASNSIKPLELLACVEESHERGATDCSDQPLGKQFCHGEPATPRLLVVLPA